VTKFGGWVAGSEWLTTGKVAAILECDRSTVFRLPHDKLPYRHSPGGQRRYRRADVLAYGRSIGIEIPEETDESATGPTPS
jgi:hypothetical protein